MEGWSEGEDSQNGWIDYIPACRSHWKDGHRQTIIAQAGRMSKGWASVRSMSARSQVRRLDEGRASACSEGWSGIGEVRVCT